MTAIDSSLLVYATRYALGRSSYAPDDVMVALRARHDLVTDAGTRVAILRDIREALTPRVGNIAIALPYADEWRETLAYLEERWPEQAAIR